MNRHKLNRAEATVNSPDELVDRKTKVLIFFDILTRGHGDLHQDYLANPLGMLFEEHFHGMKLLRNTLDVIKPINADDDLDTFKPTSESCNTIDNALLLQ